MPASAPATNAHPTHVPLNKLLLSPRNVRKTNPDEDIDSLAESIAAKGLLQNLVVSPSPTGRGFYEVDAGGRRYRALQRLVKDKALARDWPVPVTVVDPADATEASLAENLHTIAMNPADEYEAFATIIAGYEAGGVADPNERVAMCARRFGRTVRQVEQRLRLAALAPEILTSLREGRITVDAAKAYAGHPDPKLQLKIFAAEEKKGQWGHGVQAIRDAIRGRVYMTDHRAVLYVGMDAYRAAGGRVARDLFLGAEDREVLLDPAIVDRLAAEKSAEEATRLAAEAGFADGAVRAWNGPSYADPKPPKGFQATYREPEGETRAAAVLGFEVKADGSGLEPIQRWFVKAEAPAKAGAAATYGRETPEQIAARERKAAVEQRALRLAMPELAGTPLKGRTFWPSDRYRHWLPAVEREDETGDFLVAIRVRLPAAEVDAQREAAEWQLAEEEAQAAAAAKQGAEVNGTAREVAGDIEGPAGDDDEPRPVPADDEPGPAPAEAGAEEAVA